MGKVAEATSLHEIHDLLNHAATPLPAFAGVSPGDDDLASTPQQQGGPEERPWEIDIDAEGGAAAIPASHLAERMQSTFGSPVERRPDGLDIIARGVLTLDRAQELFNVYHDRLDHFVYRVLGDHRSLESVRAASPLLLSAISVVAALQTASPDFEKCYQAFLKSCSARAYSKKCAIEDVQAYCIGAFWLSDMSCSLVGTGTFSAFILERLLH